MRRLTLVLCFYLASCVPAGAATLWNCYPDSDNPSAESLTVHVTPGRITVFNSGGRELLSGIFTQPDKTTSDDGTVNLFTRLHVSDTGPLYALTFVVESKTGKPVGTLFGIKTDTNTPTLFWECQ